MHFSEIIHGGHLFTKEFDDVVAAELTRLSLLYYAGAPEASDVEFDSIFHTFKQRRPEHPYFQKVNPSPTQGKGFKHLVPMLSLETEVDSSFHGLEDFDRRVKTELGSQEKVDYVLEFKYDGLGINLLYRDGKLTRGTTRGENDIGEDISHNLDLFGASVPLVIPGLVGDLEIRGEAVMSQAEFLLINRQLESEGKPRYANPRNTVAGTIRTLTKSKVEGRSLIFFPYCFGGGNIPEHLKTQSEALEWFAQYFDFPKTKLVSPKTHTWDIGYLYSVFEAIGKNRHTLGFAIDGIVYKVNSFELQKKLGFRSATPRWAVAQKYPPETAQTELLVIDTQVGRTGKLTPVARLSPIYVGGTTITNVTLHNVFDLRRRGVRVGDIITIQRAGDVIPEIAYRNKREPRRTYVPNFKMPGFCPCCDAPVRRPKGDVEYYCTNKQCPEQVVGRLIHFVNRTCMNIKGFGEESIRHLVKAEKLNRWLDIYGLTENDLITFGKVPPANAPKVMGEIEKSKTTDFRRLIHGMGIPFVGEGTSKRIAENVKPEELPVASSKLGTIGDIGPVTVEAFARFFGETQHASDYYFFIHSVPGVKLKVPSNKGNKLQGKIVVFSGSFKTLKRDDLKAIVEDNGGKTSGSVTSNTSYFVAGMSPTKHKLEKAQSLGTVILDEESFLKLIA